MMISMQNRSALTVVTTFPNKPLKVLSSKSSSKSSASLRARQSGRRSSFSSSSFRIVRAAGAGGKGEEEKEENSVELYAGIAGLLSCAVVSYSLFTLKQTGCGLPAGPGGLVGAIEGVSYLGVAGLLGASAYKKSTTGSSAPPKASRFYSLSPVCTSASRKCSNTGTYRTLFRLKVGSAREMSSYFVIMKQISSRMYKFYYTYALSCRCLMKRSWLIKFI